MTTEMKRVKVSHDKPNPLFEKWLTEWKEEAAARGSDMQYCFGKALASLKKYPLPLNSGKDCGILQNFGNRLCVMLDRKLAEHKKQNPLAASEIHSTCNVQVNQTNKVERTHTGNKTKKSPKLKKAAGSQVRQQSSSLPCNAKGKNEYIPAYRSGSYAILVALLSHSKQEGYAGFMTKTDVQNFAQPMCDTSFTKPQAGSYYTAWSSMSLLMKKGLVSSAGRGKYALTAEGEVLAERIQNIEMATENSSGISSIDKLFMESETVSTTILHELPSTTVSSIGKQKQEFDALNTSIFAPGSFDVILLIDTQEASGVSGRKGSNDSSLNDLQKHNVLSEVRNLKIGDFVWVCRERSTGREVVLPYIIERKRVDDFAQSIMDGRFREQKFRLKQCGIQNLIYLVEKHGRESHTALPLSTLNQAAANTEVTDGFIVKYTGNHKESSSYLAYFTHFLKNIFMLKTLVMCHKKNLPSFSVKDDLVSLMSFQEFNSLSIKNKKLAVRDMFIKQLVQLNGLSVEKALAIVERYPTPHSLVTAFRNGGDAKLLADIPFGSLNRRMGPVLSKSIYELYSNSILT